MTGIKSLPFIFRIVLQYAIDNVSKMRPDSGHGMDDGSSYCKSPLREPSYTPRTAQYSQPQSNQPPSYMSLIKVHPWYTDPEGIAITLGNESLSA